MNAAAPNGNAVQHATPTKKPPPAGPAPPPPASSTHALTPTNATPRQNTVPNGTAPAAGYAQKGKKKVEPPDPVTMYESVRSRIAALEEEEVMGEEEERRLGLSFASRCILHSYIQPACCQKPKKRADLLKAFQSRLFKRNILSW